MNHITEEFEIEGKSVIKRLAGLARALATGKAVILKNGQIAKIRTGKGRQHPDARCYGVYTDREGKKWLTLGPIQWQIDRSLTLCTLICMAYMVFRFSKHEVRVLLEYVDRTNPYMGKFCDRRDAAKEYDRQVQQLVEKVEKGEINPGGIFSVLQVLSLLGNLSFVKIVEGKIGYNVYDSETESMMRAALKHHRRLYAPSIHFLRKQLPLLVQLGLVVRRATKAHTGPGRPAFYYYLSDSGRKLLRTYYDMRWYRDLHTTLVSKYQDLATLWYYSLNNERFKYVINNNPDYIRLILKNYLCNQNQDCYSLWSLPVVSKNGDVGCVSVSGKTRVRWVSVVDASNASF